MRYLYSTVLYFLVPLVVLRMLVRSLRAPEYRRRMAERFGFFGTDFESRGPTVWIHAVSVGEVIAAAPLLRQLLLDQPDCKVVFTTTTPTGSQRVRELFGDLMGGSLDDRVFHVYAPWDLPGSVRRFLKRTRPQMLLLMETELWPNMLQQSSKQGCRIILCNARMSERSAQGYQRFDSFSRSTLSCIDTVACASKADAVRFRSLGVSPEALIVTGNLKFDLTITGAMREQAEQQKKWLGTDCRSVLIAASTHAGEEQIILRAYRRLRNSGSDCLLLLVPRHPERCPEVVALCANQGWVCQRYSERNANGSGMESAVSSDIVLVDTVGDLAVLYGAATVAIIGGSFVAHGGHNPLEASVWGVPTVSGPSTFNFAEVNGLLETAGATLLLEEPDQLGECLGSLLDDAVRRKVMGEAAQQVVAKNRGALEKLQHLIKENFSAT